MTRLPLQLYEKEKITEACLSVFARHGYADTSTEMLAEAAGVSKALIFHHFGSKKKLYFNLLTHCFENVKTELRYDEFPGDTDFLEAIDRLARGKTDYFNRHPAEARLVYEAFRHAPEELKSEIAAKFGQQIAGRNRLLERLFEHVPLQEGVDRKEAFELIMIVARHFEARFSAESAEIVSFDDEYVDKQLDELHRYYSMICHGIVRQDPK